MVGLSGSRRGGREGLIPSTGAVADTDTDTGTVADTDTDTGTGTGTDSRPVAVRIVALRVG